MTNRAFQLIIAILTLFAGAGEPAMADEPQFSVKFEEPKGTRISGAQDPESIPFKIRYHIFLSNYQGLFAPSIVQELEPTDDAVLREAATTFESVKFSDQAKIDRDLVDLCAIRAKMDVFAVAEKVDQIYSESDRRREQFLEAVLARLSDSGRRFVTDFVDQNVARSINSVIPPSSVDLAHDDKDSFEYWLDLECHRATTGQYPDSVRARSAKVKLMLKDGLFDADRRDRKK